jgi:anaphase-promoting complex subunit 1
MASLALSIVMAGTGDQNCFKTLRIVRKRLDSNENNFGHQMAINMALGFLFLGSGAYTLGRSKFQIAALMCSLYPVFPKEANDNRYHLQAIRHFWVLAIESRLV